MDTKRYREDGGVRQAHAGETRGYVQAEARHREGDKEPVASGEDDVH